MKTTPSLLPLIGLTTLLTGCSAPFIGAINIGGEPIAENDTTISAQSAECPSYHPMPPALKKYVKDHNDTDPTLDPWAGWMLSLRSWLEGGGCD